MAYNRADDISDEDLAQAEKEAFARPSDASFWDERMYDTHAPVMSWADRGDDLLEASNFHAALAILTDADTGEDDPHVFDASVSHWLVGSLQQIWVRARDDSGAFTPAWRTAVAIAFALQEYPVLDESDLSERESEAFDTQFDDALWQARNAFDSARYAEDEDAPDLTDTQHALVADGVREAHSDGADFHGDSYADCNYGAVADEYARIAADLLSRPAVSLTRTTVRGQARMF